MDPIDIGRCQRHFKGFGILRYDLVDHINLFQHRLHGFRPRKRCGNVNGPELPTDTASAQAWNVSNDLGFEGAVIKVEVNCAEVIAAFVKLPGQIVVPVDEWDVLQDLANLGEARFGGCIGLGGGGDGGNHHDAGDEGWKMTNDECQMTKECPNPNFEGRRNL